jgi:hypothetical protein
MATEVVPHLSMPPNVLDRGINGMIEVPRAGTEQAKR